MEGDIEKLQAKVLEIEEAKVQKNEKIEDLDIKVLDKNNEEIDLKQNFDDEDAGLIPADEAVEFEGENVAYEGDFEGFEIGDVNEDGDDFTDFAGFGYSEDDM